MTEETHAEEAPITDVLALADSSVAQERQEGVVDVLADPEQLKRFTNLRRQEHIRYAKILYRLKDIDTIEEWEKSGYSIEYVPPPMPRILVEPDLNLRVSLDALLVKTFRSISHLVEGKASTGRVGWFGRRKEG